VVSDPLLSSIFWDWAAVRTPREFRYSTSKMQEAIIG
jgi:hypothetical protein